MNVFVNCHYSDSSTWITKIVLNFVLVAAVLALLVGAQSTYAQQFSDTRLGGLPSIAQGPATMTIVPGQNFSNIRLSTIQYGNSSISTPLKPQVAQWSTGRFDFIIGGNIDLSPYNYNTVWSLYQDGAGAYAPEIYSWVHDVATQSGFPKYEDMLLHMKQDYTVASTLNWTGLDQFDYFEQNYWQQSGQGNLAYAVKGAFTLVGTTYTDVTVPIYDNKHKVTVSDKLLLGYAEPFDLVNVVVYTGRSGGTVSWEYWTGTTWASLRRRYDTTAGMTTTGKVIFTPSPNWVPTSIKGSRSKYWVRLTISGATAAPVLSRVYGDDWASHYGTNNCRGWSRIDPHRVNIGRGNLEYNPTPPSTATARFRYQARATGNWAHNYAFANPTNLQNGVPTWSTTLLKAWADSQKSSGFTVNGMYIDDVGAIPQMTPAFKVTASDELPASTAWSQDVTSFYASFVSRARATHGTGFGVGGNVNGSPGGALALSFDFSTQEPYYTSWTNGNINLNGMDAVLPSNNPSNSKIIYTGWDNQHFGYKSSDGTFHLWDNGNRTPISVLATYYMGANANTTMGYDTYGWSYFDADEYYYWSQATTTLTSQLNADTSSATKTISMADASSFKVPGGPIWTTQYVLKIGNDVVNAVKVNSTSFTTTTPILNNYPVGTKIQFAQMGHQAVDPIPSSQNVWYWSTYFPAMSVDLGGPDPNGWHSGARDLAYILPPASSGYPTGCVKANKCSEIWRRDFMNAIILAKVAHDYTYGFELDTYSPYIQLGGTYYPLNADGTTGTGITQVRLRAGEAAILMKSPNPYRK